MENPALLLLNGSSGVGKTTIAKMLSEKDGVEWIHPDGLWDPSMDQRESTFKAIKLAVTDFQHADIVVIDMQFRHQFMLDAFVENGVMEGKQVLLYCDTADRRHRLEERRLEDEAITTMEHWAQWLYRDSNHAGNVMIDTSRHDAEDVFGLIWECFSKWKWQ
jgi:cytidylate kinase